MWIFIWVVLSLFIMGVFVWSAVILREQKTAWAAFAKKHGLEYIRRRFMEAAIVRGIIGGYRFSLFADTQQTQDVRGERYVSVIEFELGSGMATGAIFGTKEMQSFIDSVNFPHSFTPDHEKWTGNYIIKTRDPDMLKSYLNAQRLEALADIFSMNRVSALFFFDEQDAVLHIETVDPLRKAEKLDRIIARILNDVRVLALPAQGEKLLPPPQESPEQPPASTDVKPENNEIPPADLV